MNLNQLATIAIRSQPILSAQRISADGPGTILRDLETLIDFIGERGLPTQSKQGNLPAAVLPEINAWLAAPIGVRLTRPLLQHFPNIAGLFVLLRVMNLARADRKRLWIEAAALASWREFNAAEKYFALLEAWLFSADAVEILGGEPRGWSNQFADNLQFLLKLKTDRWTTFHEYCHTVSSGGAVSTWNTHRQVMFGLIAGSERPLADRRSENRGWMLEKARRTPWGEAVASVVARAVIAADEGNDMSLYRSPENAGFGFLRPAFGVYHPEWQKVFAVPRAAFRAGCHVFKVVMTDARPRGAVWRRLAVPAEATLDALAFAMLDAGIWAEKWIGRRKEVPGRSDFCETFRQETPEPEAPLRSPREAWAIQKLCNLVAQITRIISRHRPKRPLPHRALQLPDDRFELRLAQPVHPERERGGLPEKIVQGTEVIPAIGAAAKRGIKGLHLLIRPVPFDVARGHHVLLDVEKTAGILRRITIHVRRRRFVAAKQLSQRPHLPDGGAFPVEKKNRVPVLHAEVAMPVGRRGDGELPHVQLLLLHQFAQRRNQIDRCSVVVRQHGYDSGERFSCRLGLAVEESVRGLVHDRVLAAFRFQERSNERDFRRRRGARRNANEPGAGFRWSLSQDLHHGNGDASRELFRSGLASVQQVAHERTRVFARRGIIGVVHGEREKVIPGLEVARVERERLAIPSGGLAPPAATAQEVPESRAKKSVAGLALDEPPQVLLAQGG